MSVRSRSAEGAASGTPRSWSTRVGSGVGGGRQGVQPVEGLREHVFAECLVRLILRRGRRRGRAIRPMGDRMRQQPPVRMPPSLGGLDATGNTPHAQFLATEHWSLLATRSMTWNEIFSRTGTYLTVLSATVIALSLVANATGFGQAFRTFALLVLPVVLLVGVGTYFRLVEADIEDAWLVIGMNRLRHATSSSHRSWSRTL